jgi:hypothetical protein
MMSTIANTILLSDDAGSCVYIQRRPALNDRGEAYRVVSRYSIIDTDDPNRVLEALTRHLVKKDFLPNYVVRA